MRILTIATLTLMPCFALADTITVFSQPNAVEVYPQGALVTRTVTFDMPQGRHDILLPDLPTSIDAFSTEATLNGASLNTRRYADVPQVPAVPDMSEAFLAAKATKEMAQAAIDSLNDQIKQIEARIGAAQAQIGFLGGLSDNEGLPGDVDALRALSQMIAGEGDQARKNIVAAQADVRSLQATRPALDQALREAEFALQSVSRPSMQATQLTLTATAAQAGPVTLTLKYFTDQAGWEPAYRMYLTTGDVPVLNVERLAALSQFTNENWKDVDLTLSTLMPSGKSSPSRPWAPFLRIEEPTRKQSLSSTAMDRSAVADPIIEAPVIVSEMAAAFSPIAGPGSTYTFPDGITAPGGTENLQIAMGELNFDAGLSAQATPMRDDTAYRKVTFTNTSPERLLGAQSAIIYVDGRLMGSINFATIEPTQEADLFFGPIDGLLVSRTVLDRNEGDRGIISRSNENSEDIRIDIENLTDRAWDLAVFDGVPYGEQEDLVIDWTAAPKPAQVNDADRRGILRWDLTAPPASKQSISIKTKITWPEGLDLR